MRFVFPTYNQGDLATNISVEFHIVILNVALIIHQIRESTPALVGNILEYNCGLVHEKVILVLDIIAQDIV